MNRPPLTHASVEAVGRRQQGRYLCVGAIGTQAITDKGTEMLRKGAVLRFSPAPDKRTYWAKDVEQASLV